MTAKPSLARRASFEMRSGQEPLTLGPSLRKAEARGVKKEHAVIRGLYSAAGGMQATSLQQDRAAASAYPEYVAPFYPQWWRWQRIR